MVTFAIATILFGSFACVRLLLKVLNPPNAISEGKPFEKSIAQEPVFSPPDVDLPSPTLELLREKEARCVELAAKLQGAVVGVLKPSEATEPLSGKHAGGGSGVIISPDGLVLSAMHVTHFNRSSDLSKPDVSPGEIAAVLLSDGRRFNAKLLGASAEYDLSLLQITEPGPFPFIPLQEDAKVQTGDWVMKLGNPGGYRRDRPAPVRLGRVLASVDNAFATDCVIVRGDSGGPYFDLNGRLVGIMHGMDAGVLRHVNRIPRVGVLDWDIVQETWMVIATPPIALNLEPMKKGEILPGTGLAWNTGLDRASRLPVDQWMQGKTVTSIVEPNAQKLKASVIAILNEGIPVGLGTVVDNEGLAVVVASTLPPKPQCRLPDGSVADVTVVGIDKAFDIAVVRIPTRSIQAIMLEDIDMLPTGTLVAPIASDGQARVVGVVCVAPRKLADVQTQDYNLPLRLKADTGFVVLEQEPKKGPGVQVLMSYGIAKIAGIKAGDRLKSVDGRPISDRHDFANALSDQRSGNLVSVEIERDGQPHSLRIPMLPEVGAGAINATWRSDDYPIAFEYSPPVRTIECGGPLIDLSGRPVGVTVGRSNAHAGWAIPISSIRQILAEAQEGKLASSHND